MDKAAQIIAEMAQLRDRLDKIESNISQALLSVLHGLKGSDDGKDGGLYEKVRKLTEELAVVRFSLSKLELAVAQLETSRQQVSGGAQTLKWLLSGSAGGLLAWLASMASK